MDSQTAQALHLQPRPNTKGTLDCSLHHSRKHTIKHRQTETTSFIDNSIEAGILLDTIKHKSPIKPSHSHSRSHPLSLALPLSCSLSLFHTRKHACLHNALLAMTGSFSSPPGKLTRLRAVSSRPSTAPARRPASETPRSPATPLASIAVRLSRPPAKDAKL